MPAQYGDNDLPVRKRLLRRIAEGRVCGYISKQSGRPCLATPLAIGRGCAQHDRLRPATEASPVDRPESKEPGAVLQRFLSSCVSSEDATIIDEIYKYGPATLEDQIALVRLRIGDSERRFRDGYLLVDDYLRTLKTLTDLLVKLTDANAKVAANTALADRLRGEPEPEAFDPVVAAKAQAAGSE